MMYGQIKLADFYQDHDDAIAGTIKGTLLGAVIGSLKDGKQETPYRSRLKNVGKSALVGGLGGMASGALFDNQQFTDGLQKEINDLRARVY